MKEFLLFSLNTLQDNIKHYFVNLVKETDKEINNRLFSQCLSLLKVPKSN